MTNLIVEHRWVFKLCLLGVGRHHYTTPHTPVLDDATTNAIAVARNGVEGKR